MHFYPPAVNQQIRKVVSLLLTDVIPANIFSIGGELSRILGSEVSFPCEYVGGIRGHRAKRRWYKDGYELSFRKEVYLLQNAATTDSGNYTCSVTDAQTGYMDKVTYQLDVQGKQTHYSWLSRNLYRFAKNYTTRGYLKPAYLQRASK